jgi:MFS family permease
MHASSAELAPPLAPSAPARRLPLYALIAANAISTIGNMLTALAVPWFVLVTTGSPTRTGVTAAMAVLPQAIAGALGGTLVDRLGFRRMSVLADVTSGVTVALVPLLYLTVGLAFWQLLALVFLGALLDTPGGTARQSMLPDLAERAGMPLERVNSLTQIVPRLAIFLGPPLAGLLIALIGPSKVLWVDAATFAFSAGAVLLCVPSVAPAGGGGSYLDDLRDGFRFLRDNPLLLWLIATFGVSNFLLDPIFSIVLPVLVKQTFDSAPTLGLLIAALGGGTLVGVSLFGLVGSRLPRRPLLLSALVICGLPIWMLAATTSLPLLFAALLVMGLAIGPVSPVVVTLLHERTPAEYLGRVFGALGAITTATVPVGVLLAGVLLGQFSTRATLAVLAALYLVFSLTIFVNPAFRNLERPTVQES